MDKEKRTFNIIYRYNRIWGEPFKRKSLCRYLCKCDRACREDIAAAKMFFPIINTGDGYLVPDSRVQEDVALALRYYKQEYSRALSILVGLRGLKKFLNTIDQIKFKDYVDALEEEEFLIEQLNEG